MHKKGHEFRDREFHTGSATLPCINLKGRCKNCPVAPNGTRSKGFHVVGASGPDVSSYTMVANESAAKDIDESSQGLTKPNLANGSSLTVQL